MERLGPPGARATRRARRSKSSPPASGRCWNSSPGAKNNKEIAAELGLAQQTVRNLHRHRVRQDGGALARRGGGVGEGAGAGQFVKQERSAGR